jgi:hypothetical protein
MTGAVTTKQKARKERMEMEKGNERKKGNEENGNEEETRGWKGKAKGEDIERSRRDIPWLGFAESLRCLTRVVLRKGNRRRTEQRDSNVCVHTYIHVISS